MSTTTATGASRPAFSTKFFYGFGSIAYGVKDQGFQTLLLLYYNQVVGLPARWVGGAIMIALIFDSLLDPVVGQISDNWRSRWGRRHPFLYASALPVAISYLLLWHPPAWSQRALFLYLLVAAIVVRTFITLYEIPSAAMAAELSEDYDQRTSLLGYRYFFGWWGGLAMGLAAFAVFLRPDATHPVGQLNPAGYSGYALAASLLMLTSILVSAVSTHRFIRGFRVPSRREITLPNMAREMGATLKRRSVFVLLMSGFFGYAATGLVGSLSVYVNTFYWELSARQIALFTLGMFVSALLALFIATPLSRRLGKKSAAITTFGLSLALFSAPLVLRLLDLFPPNGSPWLLPILVVLNTLAITFSVACQILIASMMTDTVEESEVATGRRAEGLLYSGVSLIQKAVSGVGIFISGVILGAVHFPANARPGSVPPETLRALILVYLPSFVGLYAVAIAFLGAYRFSREDHQRNLRSLAIEG